MYHAYVVSIKMAGPRQVNTSNSLASKDRYCHRNRTNISQSYTMSDRNLLLHTRRFHIIFAILVLIFDVTTARPVPEVNTKSKQSIQFSTAESEKALLEAAKDSKKGKHTIKSGIASMFSGSSKTDKKTESVKSGKTGSSSKTGNSEDAATKTIRSKLSSKTQKTYDSLDSMMKTMVSPPLKYTYKVSSANQKKWDAEEPAKLGSEAYSRMQQLKQMLPALLKANDPHSAAQERYNKMKKESKEFDEWAIMTGHYASEKNKNFTVKSWWDATLTAYIKEMRHKVDGSYDLIDKLKDTHNFEKTESVVKKLAKDIKYAQAVQQMQDGELMRLEKLAKLH